MSIAIGIAVGASASSASAAKQAKQATCLQVMEKFQPVTATTEQKQDYAECVGFMHPQPIPSGDIFFLKVVLLLIFSCGVFAVWKECRDGTSWFSLDALMVFIVGCTVGVFGLVVIAVLAFVFGGVPS